nr:unnamed protein product [Digitaria exilis]
MASIVGGAVVAAAAGGGGVGVGATPHVLAVDDSSVDRAIIAAILRSSRFRVTAVDSGKRALELLGKMPGGRSGGFPGEARARVGRVACLQPRAPLSSEHR